VGVEQDQRSASHSAGTGLITSPRIRS
jgi:hypothetical protein